MPKIKPFLKWAGNKFQIIEKIQAALPNNQDTRLIEPFLGSGAIFLNTNYKRYLLADNNFDLINLYLHLKQFNQEFIDYCKTFFTDKQNSKKNFLVNRALFNNTGSNTAENKKLRAALFVYLNKHSYNGLCRFNSSGKFNVSFGKYKKPYFPEKEMQAFAKKAKKAVFKHHDFKTTMEKAKPGDIIYCDPPYVPLSSTANFTSYSAGGFGLKEQEILVTIAKKLAKSGVTVIISNHDTEFVNKIYQGAKIAKFPVQRFISCKGNNRNKANEILAVFEC